MLDYLRGGKDNYKPDRRLGDLLLEAAPELVTMLREGRKFLSRAVWYLAGQGVRQYVEIGCGLPTRGSLHQILAKSAPDSKVVYVDNDPMVVRFAQALVDGPCEVRVVGADARDAKELLSRPEIGELLDVREPTAVILQGVISTILDDDVATRMVRDFADWLSPGGYVVFSHPIQDLCAERTDKLIDLFHEGEFEEGGRRNGRSLEEIALLLDGLELVPPGLVPTPAWRPLRGEPTVDITTYWGISAIGRKP
ncbi:SAM-dependent methyltransferase [Actinocorallia longicatena]|uniref:SAM-dependent methyltransferase n=1 Tax=Actinocorallia longicatena TaxID=111803 RepID=A0ABP6Q8R7_9ACTN